MYEQVDGNEVGTCDGYITIFGGTGDSARIIRFIQTANGDSNDKFITLEMCRKQFSNQYGGDGDPVLTVIFEDWTHGDIYKYGNHGDCWEKVGETIGFV